MENWGAGILWYDRETFERMKALADDPDKMPLSYDQWLVVVESSLKHCQQLGIVIRKIKVDPEHFALWCDTKEIKRDANARKAYSSIEGLSLYQGEN